MTLNDQWISVLTNPDANVFAGRSEISSKRRSFWHALNAGSHPGHGKWPIFDTKMNEPFRARCGQRKTQGVARRMIGDSPCRFGAVIRETGLRAAATA